MAMKLLYLLAGLDIMNLSMFIVTFAPYVRSLGGSHSLLGIIMSSCAVVSLFWNPIAGSLGDNNGRKGILIKCLAISLIGNISSIFLQSFTAIFICRLLCAFGAPTGSLIRTIVTDVAKNQEEKSTAMNKIGGFSAIMFMTGALLEGFINERKNGVIIVYTIISLNLIISIACASFLPNKVVKQNKKEKSEETNKLKKAFSSLKEIDWKKYWELFTIKLFIDLCYGIMQSNLGLIMATVFHIRGRQMGYVMALISIFTIITNFAMIRLKKTLYASDDGFQRLTHGTVLLIITFAGLGLSSQLYVFMTFVITMSIARTLIDSTLTDVLTNKTSDNDKGGILSLFESIISLTGMVSPLISGVIADRFGEQIPILLCTAPAFLATVIAYRQKSKSIKAD